MPMELVTNGGFETGSLGPWTLSGNGGFSSVTTFAPAAGSWNYRNGAVGSFGTINQTVATIAGRVYSFSFDLTNEGRPTNAFQADLGGTAFGPVFTNSGPFGYTNYSGTVVAPTTNATLRFSFRQDPSFWRIDNISLVGNVPEPASWAMMIAGFGLTGAAMRRRRSVALTA
jgi:hypothetical protein